MAYNAEKTNKQTNKTNTGKSYKKFYLQRFGENKSYPNQITHIPPPPSTPQKSNGRPLFSQNSESCASFQTRRTRRLVEKNNNNNQNFLRGNFISTCKGNVYVNWRKCPYLPRVYCRVTLCGISAVPKIMPQGIYLSAAIDGGREVICMNHDRF